MEIVILIFISWCVAIAHFAMKQEREADAELMEAAIDQARIDGYEMGKLVPEVCEIPIIKFDRDIHLRTLEAIIRVHVMDNRSTEHINRELSRGIAEQIIAGGHFLIKHQGEDFVQYSNIKMTVAVVDGEDIIKNLR